MSIVVGAINVALPAAIGGVLHPDVQIALRVDGAVLVVLSLNHLPGRIISALRIAAHVGIGVHPLQIALLFVRREENTHHRVVVARDVIVQSRQGVIVLAGETLGRVEGALGATCVAVGTKHLAGLDGRSTCRPADIGEDAAQGVGEQVEGAVGIQITDETAAQEVVIGVPLVGAGATVLVLLASKGIDHQGSAVVVDGAGQHAGARGIVDIPFLVGRAGIPFH